VARGAGTFYDVCQTDGDLFTLRAPGDTVLLWTDGVTELRGGAEPLGGERLEQMLTAADLGESSQRAASRIADAVRSFAPAPLQDDMAIVVVQVTPAAASDVAA
jgi:serine phosphatase RsbU (regulator of sigma subunit)